MRVQTPEMTVIMYLHSIPLKTESIAGEQHCKQISRKGERESQKQCENIMTRQRLNKDHCMNDK